MPYPQAASAFLNPTTGLYEVNGASVVDPTLPPAAKVGARANYFAQRSFGKALADTLDNAGSVFTENWAALTAWTLPGTPGQQVSGNKVYSTGSGGAGSGANHAISVLATENFRATFLIGIVAAASGSGQMIVGVSKDAAGATPTSGATQGVGLSFAVNTTSNPLPLSWNGSSQGAVGVNNLFSMTMQLTITADQQWISFVARRIGGPQEYRYRVARSAISSGAINNLYIFNSDGRGTSGNYVGLIGFSKQFATMKPSAAIDQAGTPAHWTGDGTQNFKITLPPGYDSRVPVPVVVCFHGNGSDENHFSDNSNGSAVSYPLLAAGYAVISCTLAANNSTWGANASLSAYKAALTYFRDRYALSTVLVYANSMGGIESFLAVAGGYIPGVAAMAMSHPTASLAANYATTFTTLINTAYGITGTAPNDYATATAGHDPILLNPALFQGIPLWAVYASDDTTVVATDNILPMALRLQSAGVQTTIVSATPTGAGHSTDLTPYVSGLVAFFNSALGL